MWAARALGPPPAPTSTCNRSHTGGWVGKGRGGEGRGLGRGLGRLGVWGGGGSSAAQLSPTAPPQNRIAAFDSMCRLADDGDKEVIEILDRRVEFIHMGAIREAVTAISMGEEKILEGAMKMITEFLHFPQVGGDALGVHTTSPGATPTPTPNPAPTPCAPLHPALL